MRKYKFNFALGLSLILFLLVNTQYFWLPALDLVGFLLLFIITGLFILTGLYIIVQLGIILIYKDYKELYYYILPTLLLILIAVEPFGLISFHKMEGKDLLVARREGTANCNQTLFLKNHHNYIQRSSCFGVREEKGSFSVSGDSVFFQSRKKNEPDFEFGILKTSKQCSNCKILILYRNQFDTIGQEFEIRYNEVFK